MACLLLLAAPGPARVEVSVPVTDRGEVEVGALLGALADRFGLRAEPPEAPLPLPARGVAAALTRTFLLRGLGPGAEVAFRPGEVVVSLLVDPADPAQLRGLEARLAGLSARASAEARRRLRFGFRPRPSYRPGDPSRPTVCLVHGLNSNSTVFVHMFGPIEAAGYGVVVYDFPDNRDLDESAEAFGRDWAEFRRATGDERPWAIVAHSMGALLARDYLEGDGYRGDVASLIMLAPVNGGSGLAGAQTLLQFVQGMQAANGAGRPGALMQISDGLGEAAEDLLPGSAFLRALNARPRRAGVAYHILAGDVGFLSAEGRRRVEARFGLVGRAGGLLGGLSKLAAGDLAGRLDELTDGTGDGCVAVERTRLEGVADHRTIRANHLELIRAPLLFPEPGPVASMPEILGWLAEDLPPGPGPGADAPARRGLAPR